MLKKVLLAVVAIVALAIGLAIHEQGADKAFGGALTPIESVPAGEPTRSLDPPGSLVTGQSVPNTSPMNYQQMVDRLRSRVDNAMDRSVDRASGRQ